MTIQASSKEELFKIMIDEQNKHYPYLKGFKIKSLEAVLHKDSGHAYPFFNYENSNIVFCPFRYILQ